jgi:hypothetical protein
MKEAPPEVLEEYGQYKDKVLRCSNMSTKEYHAMRHRFIKFGLHSPQPRKDAILKSSLDKEEFLARQRSYLKTWRKGHPGYPNKDKVLDKDGFLARQREYMREWRDKHPDYNKRKDKRTPETGICLHCRASLDA